MRLALFVTLFIAALFSVGASAQQPSGGGLANIDAHWIPPSLRADLPVKIKGRLVNVNPVVADIVYGQLTIMEVAWSLNQFRSFVESKLLKAPRFNVLHQGSVLGTHHKGFYLEVQSYDSRSFPSHAAYFLVLHPKNNYLFWYSDYGPFFQRDFEQVLALVKGIKLK